MAPDQSIIEKDYISELSVYFSIETFRQLVASVSDFLGYISVVVVVVPHRRLAETRGLSQ